MYRTLFAVAALGLLTFAGGCTMCASPYDYCGPTFTGCDGQQCDPIGRAGSIMVPVGPGPEPAVAVEPAVATNAEPQPAAEPAAESSSEAVAESSSDSQANKGTIVYEEKIGETDRAVSELTPAEKSGQWTARRSSRIMLR